MIRPCLLSRFLASPALPEPFVILIHETPDQIALRDDSSPEGAANWAGHADWGKRAAHTGILQGGAALEPVSVATLGAPDASALLLAGFFQIDVADAATAESWAP